MDVYLARQPIFDRNMRVFGYELLYRKSMNNFYEGTDDAQSTIELIKNAFLTMYLPDLTGGQKAFINFSRNPILHDLPLLLPSKSIVVEILERVEVDEALVAACRNLRQKGYILALDDFVFDEKYLPLLELAHIIKIEFTAIPLAEQKQLIEQYGNRIKFLAERVETWEDYQIAYDMGYDYFQGYFFSKPILVKEKEIVPINANLLRIMSMLNSPNPDFQKLADAIMTDLGLSFKLLRLANSVYYGSRNEIRNMKQALVQLGLSEMKKWIYILMLTDKQTIENRELIQNCFIRAKFMELLAKKSGQMEKHCEYFITGMFSAIDVLLNRDMEKILNEVFLPKDVKAALLGQESAMKYALDVALSYERLDPEDLIPEKIPKGVEKRDLVNLYLRSLAWANELEY